MIAESQTAIQSPLQCCGDLILQNCPHCSRTVKISRDLLPLDPTNTSIGISEREIKTEDDEVVCKEITCRKISEDASVLASLMTARADPTNATIDSPNGRAIQVMHVVGELLRIGNPNPLYQYFNTYNATTGDWEPRSIDDTIYRLLGFF